MLGPYIAVVTKNKLATVVNECEELILSKALSKSVLMFAVDVMMFLARP